MANESFDGASPDAKGDRSTLSSVLLIVALTVLVAMAYVQRGRVPGPVEIAVRTTTSLGGWVVVPILLGLGLENWLSSWRSKLPPWRNGLALSSIVLSSLAWVSQFFHVDPPVFATFLATNLLAGLLAIALKRKSRLLVVSAVVLLWAGFLASIYI